MKNPDPPKTLAPQSDVLVSPSISLAKSGSVCVFVCVCVLQWWSPPAQYLIYVLYTVSALKHQRLELWVVAWDRFPSLGAWVLSIPQTYTQRSYEFH